MISASLKPFCTASTGPPPRRSLPPKTAVLTSNQGQRIHSSSLEVPQLLASSNHTSNPVFSRQRKTTFISGQALADRASKRAEILNNKNLPIRSQCAGDGQESVSSAREIERAQISNEDPSAPAKRPPAKKTYVRRAQLNQKPSGSSRRNSGEASAAQLLPRGKNFPFKRSTDGKVSRQDLTVQPERKVDESATQTFPFASITIQQKGQQKRPNHDCACFSVPPKVDNRVIGGRPQETEVKIIKQSTPFSTSNRPDTVLSLITFQRPDRAATESYTLHWGLWISDDAKSGTLYHVSILRTKDGKPLKADPSVDPDREFRIGYSYVEDFRPAKSKSVRKIHGLARGIPGRAVHVAGTETERSYPYDRGDNNCQNWVIRVLGRLRDRGFLTNDQLQRASKMPDPSYLANWDLALDRGYGTFGREGL